MHNVQTDEQTGDSVFTIILPKENSPLGIHVVPFNNNSEEQVHGLVLQTIEPDGRIKRQGLLEVNDRIIEINRTNIEPCSFDKYVLLLSRLPMGTISMIRRAQQIFRSALQEPELELKIVRSTKQSSSSFFLNHLDSNDFPLASKRMGKIMKITLVKGTDGLGFKLASRDNPTGTANPIYVKTIFGKGAAIEDGRLRNGDRLLTVNSVDVTRMSLQDAVGLLRETRAGDTVHLCVSRQQDGSLPKELVSSLMSMIIASRAIALYFSSPKRTNIS
jgi:C-terminal processing protease CtpA/Prc